MDNDEEETQQKKPVVVPVTKPMAVWYAEGTALILSRTDLVQALLVRFPGSPTVKYAWTKEPVTEEDYKWTLARVSMRFRDKAPGRKLERNKFGFS